MLDRQIPLTGATRSLLYGAEPAAASVASGDRPRLDAIVAQIAAAHPQRLARLVALTRWCSRIPRDYPSPGRSTAARGYGDFGTFQWGGSEEMVIAKGSPWPQEIARVLATLLQRAGIPARLVFLYRAEPPRLHTAVEAWALGGWGVCDACANRCYVWPHHGYASAAVLQQQPRLVDQVPEHGHNPYVDSAFYRTVAIAEYPLAGFQAAGGPEAFAPWPARPEDAPSLRCAARAFGG